MKKTPLAIATQEGWLQANGWTDPEVPGLVIARNPLADDPPKIKAPWAVYHHQGKILASPFYKRDDAMAAAKRLAGLADWTLSEGALRMVTRLRNEVYAKAHEVLDVPA